MEKSTSCPTREAESLRTAYAALNRNDVAGFMAVCDPQIVRVEPEGFPRAGTYRGFEAVKEHITDGRGTWAEGGCEPERFIARGDQIIALVHVRVRLKHETEWREGRIADVFTFRDGKAIEFRTLTDAQAELEWAAARGAS